MELKSYQRAFLRSHAQALDPVVSVGKDGASDSVVKALDDALTVHELVKVRFHSFKDEVDSLSRYLEEKTSICTEDFLPSSMASIMNENVTMVAYP